MTLSPEQFNLLTTKKDLEKLVTKVEMNDRFDAVFSVLDTIVKKLDNIERENISNISAHARINRDLLRVKDYTGLDAMEVVEQV